MEIGAGKSRNRESGLSKVASRTRSCRSHISEADIPGTSTRGAGRARPRYTSTDSPSLTESPRPRATAAMRHREAERLGGFEIDDEVVAGWLLDRKITRQLALKQHVHDPWLLPFAAAGHSREPWPGGSNRVYPAFVPELTAIVSCCRGGAVGATPALGPR